MNLGNHHHDDNFCGVSGGIKDISASASGELCCTVAEDKIMKVFDVINFGKF